jgi:dephospho-CoA kinase
MSAGRSMNLRKGRRRRVVIVGLVGGIGGGKSFVASLFAERGARIVDADRIVRRLLRLPAVRARIRRVWGPPVFRRDGSIDPAALAAVVFRDPAELRKLNRILHPLVRREMRAAISRSRARLLVVDAPLLLEAGIAGWCDRIVFVDAPRAMREARVRRERGWSAGELRRREGRQLPLARKRAAADWVIRNAGSARETRAGVARVLEGLK